MKAEGGIIVGEMGISAEPDFGPRGIIADFIRGVGGSGHRVKL